MDKKRPYQQIGLHNGPLDGCVLFCFGAESLGDLPVEMAFTYDAAETIDEPIQRKTHVYIGIASGGDGPIAGDGYPVREWVDYQFKETTTEMRKSIKQVWDETP